MIRKISKSNVQTEGDEPSPPSITLQVFTYKEPIATASTIDGRS
jgi:hypothetical protein